jgi:hypothetical protein
LGDGDGSSDGSFLDDVGEKEKRAFHLNLGRTITALQRGLPLVFQDQSGMDFSIFAPVVTVMVDGMVLPLHKSMYIAGVRSFRVAALFSAAEPSLCLRKVEYLESFRTIQCLVDVLLPDTVPLGDGGGRGGERVPERHGRGRASGARRRAGGEREGVRHVVAAQAQNGAVEAGG